MRAFLCIRSKNSQTMNMGLTHAQRLARWHNSGMNKSLSMGQRAFKGALESISDIVAFALGKKKESAIKQKLFFSKISKNEVLFHVIHDDKCIRLLGLRMPD